MVALSILASLESKMELSMSATATAGPFSV